MSDIGRSIEAWRSALSSVLDVGRSLQPDEWSRPTECPQWSVKDIYAHLVGGELWMAAGNPRPERGIGEWADEPVLARRDRPGEAVLAELRALYADRCADIDAHPPDPTSPSYAATGGESNLELVWRIRAFDAWVHEQDIRRAIGRPGNLSAAGAGIARDLILASLPRIVAKQAKAAPGSVLRFGVSGDIEFDVTVEVDQDGRGRLTTANHAQPSTMHLRTDWETFARLGAGRISPATAGVAIEGDHDVAYRVLSNLSITP